MYTFYSKYFAQLNTKYHSVFGHQILLLACDSALWSLSNESIKMIKILRNYLSRFFFVTIFILTIPFSQDKGTSPYSFSNDIDLTIAGVSGGLLLGSMLMNYEPMDLTDISSLDPNDISNFDSKAIDNWNLNSMKMSDLLLFSSIAAPGLLMVDKKIRNDYRNFSLIWAESIFLTLGITNFTKVLVGRPRPYLYADNASNDYKVKKDNRKSFFSGHTSIAAVSWFVMASMYDDYQPENTFSSYLWASAFLVPAYTAYCRYDAGKHFPSDLITGYLVGAAAGVLVPKWHTKSSDVNISFSLQPSGKIKTRLAYRF